MSIPLDNFLGDEETINVIRNDIPLGVWISNSGRQLMANLREAGLHFSDNAFWQVRQEIFEAIENRDKIARLDVEDQIPAAFHNEGRFWYMQGNFAYKVGYFVRGEDGENLGSKWVTIQSDTRLTPGEIQAAAEDLLTSERDNYNYTLAGFIGIGASHRPGLYGA